MTFTLNLFSVQDFPLAASPVIPQLAIHFAEPLNLEEIAQRAHMSKSTLGRCFQECFGMSPMNYLTDLRLKHAEHLLRDTKIQICDIAPRVGIEDASYFARLFRKHTGLEPSAYREKMSRAKEA